MNAIDKLDRFSRRLTEAIGIPATRFWGGTNSTDDSDVSIYSQIIAAQRGQSSPAPLIGDSGNRLERGELLKPSWVERAVEKCKGLLR